MNSNDEFVSLLNEYKVKSIEAFDRSIVTLSAGAIVLSVTFLNVLIKNSHTQVKWALLVAWLCFIISVVIVLGSHLVSVKVMDKAYERKKAEAQGETPEQNGGRDWNKLARWFRNTSGISFVGGLIFMCFFAWTNLEVTELANKKGQGRVSRVKEERSESQQFTKSIEEPFQNIEPKPDQQPTQGGNSSSDDNSDSSDNSEGKK